ncbi:uncharacterized protein LOC123908012 isoform X2 [Trifolium pratense]|uniref:uncharacterized protein LOC123908012 isoform X2 n=1 Tax=Trifolium pratense TaxID=57577 RepID=UPI001E6901A0|nr:uncharacterized protein LOC123908012 isoform X2 [Trifolium pratense]
MMMMMMMMIDEVVIAEGIVEIEEDNLQKRFVVPQPQRLVEYHYQETALVILVEEILAEFLFLKENSMEDHFPVTSLLFLVEVCQLALLQLMNLSFQVLNSKFQVLNLKFQVLNLSFQVLNLILEVIQPWCVVVSFSKKTEIKQLW